MRVITLARKPLPKGGSVAENVTRYGTGGLNIDGCRVDTSSNDPNKRRATGEQGGADSMFGVGNLCRPATLMKGRWPSNVILEHRPECVCVGSRQVKGPGWHQTGADGTKGYQGESTFRIHEMSAEEVRERVGWANEDGKETVPVWDCHPECPIAVLDVQSGDCPTGLGGITKKNNSSPVYSGPASSQTRETIGYGDTGGASRFFNQVQNNEERVE